MLRLTALKICRFARSDNMAKNLIPQIAHMLGVEIGEEFKVDRYAYNGLTFKFAENMLVKPKFMCVITANSTAVVRNPENGIYILPITALKP